ncbi:sodium:proline symporter [bacterium]|nr:sodium:proline symporter [bacterium]
MPFSPLDLWIIAAYLLFSLGVGWWFRKSASRSLGDFLLGGRNLPWWLAGLSMVATTFAADTPLWVAERVAHNGISGNWLWWNMLVGGMLTTFFFARYWRRSGVLTEPELIELRYGGRPSRVLRGVKAVYLGGFLNLIIIAWVNRAMLTILKVFFDLPEQQAFLLLVALMVLTAVYSSLSGLIGVAVTDAVQFALAMIGSVVLAVVVLRLPEVGGISGLKAQLPAWRFDFFPSWGAPSISGDAVGGFSLGLGAFLSYFTLQWWASWYPGNEPGGGGYISQRMMSVRDEQGAVYSSLMFQIAHYALRPWPWIVVGLCVLVVHPGFGTERAAEGYVLLMRDHLPSGLKGLLFVAFLAAYMSTISTQLNWGAGYLVNDLYGRFWCKADGAKREAQLVRASKGGTLLLMAASVPVSWAVGSIDAAAQFLIASGAGLGAVLILRWYWWRINAWSEIAATLTPLFALAIAKFGLEPHFGADFIRANGSFYFTVAVTTVVWLVVTFRTAPVEAGVLRAFYQRVQPDGWWQGSGLGPNRFDSGLLVSWASAVVLTYAVLFATGGLIFGFTSTALGWGLAAGVSGIVLWRSMRKTVAS